MAESGRRPPRRRTIIGAIALSVIMIGVGIGIGAAIWSGGDSSPKVSAAGDETPNLKSENFNVWALFRTNLPKGTRLRVDYRGGPGNNCTEREGGGDVTTKTDSEVVQLHGFFAKSGDPWETCAYEFSNGHFLVSILAPSQDRRSVRVNLQQVAPLNSYTRSFRIECQEGFLKCQSQGTDTVSYPFGKAPAPSVTIGPMEDLPSPLGYKFKYCVQEHEVCDVGQRDLTRVAYGVGEQWKFRQSARGNIPCEAAAFGGDPAVGVFKACYVEYFEGGK